MALVFFGSLTGFSQESPTPTRFVEITGKLKRPVKLTLEDIRKLPDTVLGDLTITNHLGEYKSTQKGLRGVKLTSLLKSIEFESPSPKQLSEFYLVAEASDGYKIVYSWNELFNNPAGETVFLITQKEGLPLDQMKESMLLVNLSDQKTGRRNVKALAKIRIERAQ
jgi:hypothetical protein